MLPLQVYFFIVLVYVPSMFDDNQIFSDAQTNSEAIVIWHTLQIFPTALVITSSDIDAWILL